MVYGYASVFSTPTLINNQREGTFMEQIAPGAFTRTLRDNPVPHFLYAHGSDLICGSKPIGHLTGLVEDTVGLRFSAELYDDSSYARDLIGPLSHGMGASFQFSSDREDFDPNPGRTSWNPRGLPLRTVRDATLKELGPCLTGAYPDAYAALQLRTATPGVPPSTRVAVPARQHVSSGSPHVPVASGNRQLDVRHRVAVAKAIPQTRILADVNGVPPTGLVDGCPACEYLRQTGWYMEKGAA
jgi:HK97 family phage prohead protease